MDFKKDEFATLPIWVKLFDIPMVYWTKMGISIIESRLGKPLVVDEVTSNGIFGHCESLH